VIRADGKIEVARGTLFSGALIFVAALGYAQMILLPESPQVQARNHVVSFTLHAVN
jgi:hypothetical protein